MRLLICADLHSFKWYNVYELLKNQKNIDGILLLGDINEGYFINFKETYPNIPILLVLGNHDFSKAFDRHPYIRNINGITITIGDKIIGGIEGSVKLNNGNYIGHTQEEALEIAEKMEKADILMTHTSPKGIHEIDQDVHIGFEAINKYIEKYKPLLHLHGHQHFNKISKIKETMIIGIYGISILEIKDNRIKIENIMED